MLYPLDQIRPWGYRQPEYDGCAVYFLWLGPKLQYIGATTNYKERLDVHKAAYRNRVKWRRWFPFNGWSFFAVKEEHLAAVEAEYIREYRPFWNFRIP